MVDSVVISKKIASKFPSVLLKLKLRKASNVVQIISRRVKCHG